jgi:hypothetical protein
VKPPKSDSSAMSVELPSRACHHRCKSLEHCRQLSHDCDSCLA